MRHAAGSCVYRQSFSSDLLERQARELAVERPRLPPDSIKRIAIAATRAPEGSHAVKVQRLQSALEKLRQLYTWDDIDKAEHRKRRGEIERQLKEVSPNPPVELRKFERGMEYLSPLGQTWDDAPLEERREIVNLVFEEVRIGARGIQHVELQEPDRSLLSARGRIGRGGRSLPDKLDHLWSPSEVTIGGVDRAVG